MSDADNTNAKNSNETGEPDQQSSSRADPTTYLRYAGVGLLALLAAIATFQFYTNTSRAIGTFVANTYEPAFQAAFNLVVVLVAVAAISILLRGRLRSR